MASYTNLLFLYWHLLAKTKRRDIIEDGKTIFSILFDMVDESTLKKIDEKLQLRTKIN